MHSELRGMPLVRRRLNVINGLDYPKHVCESMGTHNQQKSLHFSETLVFHIRHGIYVDFCGILIRLLFSVFSSINSINSEIIDC
jgi:hypothetical protein